MKTITNKFKIALVAVGFLAMGTVSAQRTDTSTNAGTDFNKQANTVLGEDGGSVKVVDNKGTIKYLQASNGLTVFTDTAPSGGVVTTWQIGGTLTDETYIDVDGNVFALDGIELVDTAVLAASTDATTESDHGTGTGFTILVRDEATGAIKKILAEDLLQVNGIRVEYTQGTDIPASGTDDGSGNATSDVGITVTGLPTLTDVTTAAKLFVYRNGVKLRFGTDFTVAADTVTITYSATDLPMYDGDVIEVQYIR